MRERDRKRERERAKEAVGSGKRRMKGRSEKVKKREKKLTTGEFLLSILLFDYEKRGERERGRRKDALEMLRYRQNGGRETFSALVTFRKEERRRRRTTIDW